MTVIDIPPEKIKEWISFPKNIALVAWPGTDGLDASDPADAQAQPSPSFLCPEMINREYGLGLKYA